MSDVIFFDRIVNHIKKAVIAGLDDGTWALAELDEMIATLQATKELVRHYIEFNKLPGEVYTINPEFAAWIYKATEQDPDMLYGDMKAALQYVNVREFAGQLWLVGTDGYRLHAHQIADLEPGVYLMVENKLKKLEDKKFPDWTTAIPKEPKPVLVGEYEHSYNEWAGLSYAIWHKGMGTLSKDCQGEIYCLNEKYWLDALSYGGEPSFVLGEPIKAQPTYSRRMFIQWADAFACIMPTLPE